MISDNIFGTRIPTAISIIKDTYSNSLKFHHSYHNNDIYKLCDHQITDLSFSN